MRVMSMQYGVLLGISGGVTIHAHEINVVLIVYDKIVPYTKRIT